MKFDYDVIVIGGGHEILIEDVMLIVFVETLYQKGHIMFLLGTEFFGVI